MEINFKIEIISPEKIIFSDNATMVTLPSYEGDMGVLKDHISIITFLRPGIIKVYKNDNKSSDEFFVEDGTVEYSNNSLIVLSSSAINIKDVSKDLLNNLSADIKNKLTQKDITDHDYYILNHKLDVLKEMEI